MASVITNTAISLAGRAGGVVVGLFITAILGRVLGVDQFGSYSLLLSFGAILHIITDGGLYLVLTKEMSGNEEDAKKAAEVIGGLRLALFVLVFVVGALLLFMLPRYRPLIPLYGIAALGFLFQSLSQLLMAVFQARASMWRAAVGDIVGRFGQLAVVGMLAAGLVAGSNALPVAVGAFAVGAALAYVVHAYTARSYVAPWRFAGSLSAWKPIIARSWPLGAMLILNAIYFRTDIVIISWFRSAHEVGLYGFAYRIVESALFFPAAFGGLLLPRLVAAKTPQERSALVEQALFVMMVVGGLLYATVPPLAEGLTVLLVGSGFAGAGALLSVLLIALVVMFFGNVFGFALVALEQQKILLKLYGWLALGNVLANILVVPHFGAIAAAWTTVCTEAIAMGVAGFFVKRHVPFTLSHKSLISVVVASGAVFFFVHMLSTSLHAFVVLLLGACLYIAALVAVKVIHRDRVPLLLTSRTGL